MLELIQMMVFKQPLEKVNQWFIFWGKRTEKGLSESHEYGVSQRGWDTVEVVASLPISQEGSMKKGEFYLLGWIFFPT